MAKKRKGNATKAPKTPAPKVESVSNDRDQSLEPVQPVETVPDVTNEVVEVEKCATNDESFSACSPQNEPEASAETAEEQEDTIEESAELPPERIDVEDDHASVDTPENRTTESQPVHELYNRFNILMETVVKEKRTYDYFVHSMTKKLTEATAQKNKLENELEELAGSVSKVLSEIGKIKTDPGRYIATVDVSVLRGPPLPTQDELFSKAWNNGQIKNSYTGYSQRWQSCNRYKSWGS